VSILDLNQNYHSNSRITIVTQARETPRCLAKPARVPICGLLTIFWYFKARSYLETLFFNFLVLILCRRWPSRSGNSALKKFEFRTDEGSQVRLKLELLSSVALNMPEAQKALMKSSRPLRARQRSRRTLLIDTIYLR